MTQIRDVAQWRVAEQAAVLAAELRRAFITDLKRRGGFSYVGSLHEGFPLALEISKKKYNAFVIRYRIDSEQRATADLAAAIDYIFRNADALGVSTKDYSLWGGSAGARMVGNIALSEVAAYAGGNLPKPSIAVV